jgi:lysozyme
MNDTQKAKLRQMLLDDEGYRQFPYKCTAGKLTVGIGRNLEARGISKEEAFYLLNQDIDYFTDFLKDNLPFFDSLSENRQNVLVNMCFNLGTHGFMKFKKMINHVSKGQFEQAVAEMLDSKWIQQVPNRAMRLCEMMREG